MYLYLYRTPACHTLLDSSLCELCHWMGIGKIKLGQFSQTRQLFCIQTSTVDQSEVSTLILIAKKLHAL